MTQSVREAAEKCLTTLEKRRLWIRSEFGINGRTMAWEREQDSTATVIKDLISALARPDPPCPNCVEMTKQRDHYMEKVAEQSQIDDCNDEMEASTRLLVADTTSSSIATFYARFLVSRLDESRTLSEKLRAAMEAWKKVFPQHGLVAPQFLEAAERLTEEASEGKG